MTMQLIETVTLSSAASSITFSNIPQDGLDLYVLGSLRNSVGDFAGRLRVNNDSGTNYPHLQLFGSGSSANGSYITSFDYAQLLNGIQSDWTANTFSNWDLAIGNYADSRKHNLITLTANENNGSTGWNGIASTHHQQSTPVTSLVFISPGNFVVGSTISLYKITE